MTTSANIATYQPRVESGSLEDAVDSLIDQVDIVRIYFNDCEPPDYWKEKYKDKGHKLLAITKGDNLTDNGKFYWLEVLKEPETFLTCDDDIIYPSDYVEITKEALKESEGVVTYHGRQLQGYNREYFKGHKWFRYFDHVPHNVIVDVPGTGVSAIDTSKFHPKNMCYSPYQKMADLVLGLDCAKNSVNITLIKHNAGWLKSIENQERLYVTEKRKGGHRQMEVANTIFKLNHDHD